jgi:threonine/homoserine/homoserine lactone efflux protein
MASAQAFAIVRLVGAIVMISLGVQLLWQASRARATVVEQPGTAPPALPAWSTLVKAYGANVFNVKAAAVYLTLAPQFLSADQAGVPSMVALGLLHIAIQVTWLTLCILGWGTLVRRVDPARWRRRVDALGGLVLVALGIRSAVTTR